MLFYCNCPGFDTLSAVEKPMIFFKIVWPCIVTDSLWIRPIGALNSNFIGITTLHVSGSLSAHHQEFLAVHRLWYIFCSCASQLHKMYQSRCTAKNWWWAERLPETCRVVIPIRLKFSASVVLFTKKPMTILVSVSSWETWVDVDVWTDGGTWFIFPENFFLIWRLRKKRQCNWGKRWRLRHSG